MLHFSETAFHAGVGMYLIIIEAGGLQPRDVHITIQDHKQLNIWIACKEQCRLLKCLGVAQRIEQIRLHGTRSKMYCFSIRLPTAVKASSLHVEKVDLWLMCRVDEAGSLHTSI
jgi:hypothetical protein